MSWLATGLVADAGGARVGGGGVAVGEGMGIGVPIAVGVPMTIASGHLPGSCIIHQTPPNNTSPTTPPANSRSQGLGRIAGKAFSSPGPVRGGARGWKGSGGFWGGVSQGSPSVVGMVTSGPGIVAASWAGVGASACTALSRAAPSRDWASSPAAW